MTAAPQPRRLRTRAAVWAEIEADPEMSASLSRLCSALIACALSAWQAEQRATAEREDANVRR